MIGRKHQSFENLFSNEELAKWLNKLEWKWQPRSETTGKEIILIKDIEERSLLVASFVRNCQFFALDDYEYMMDGVKRLERSGIKVSKPPKPKPYKILKGFK